MNRWHPLPAEIYSLVEQTPATVLLECGNPDARKPHAEFCSRLFTVPLSVLEANETAEISKLFADIESAVANGLFVTGFFAYECGNYFEPKAAMRPSLANQPLAWFGIYDRPYLFDHRTGVFENGFAPDLAQFQASSADEGSPAEPLLDASLDLAKEQYAERIAAIHEWIRAGDVYQLNFTVPMQVSAPGSAAALYARLRSRQPVEFGAFLHWQTNRHILSFSPELFFKLESIGSTRRITTRPMKGTAPRGRTTREDRGLAEWLRNDEKNRSENLMIVDLLRNDLGRISNFGGVRVENLFAVERFRTLWQMTSTVSGDLCPEAGFEQIFRALFPCGSITGAPKVRAMQLLAKIEEQPRGVYTGAIGFFSRERTVFNVAIRTLELDGKQGKMGVGSGIVIDSNAAEEHRECLLKAGFLTRPAQRFPENFSLVETLLWNREFPFLELHLDRLEDSADYFGFFCDRMAAKAALLDHAGAFRTQEPRKVRLLLDSDGSLQIASELFIESISNISKPCRVRVSQQRTDAQDPMLFHKTTQRPLYAEAFKAAAQAGFDDVLFLNRDGEVTECAMANIFVEIDGQWLTPPVDCGLLAGVYRRHLLETRPGCEERVLRIEDLRKANAVYLSNAVRGLRPVEIDWKGQKI